jgi:hypothetical protein
MSLESAYEENEGLRPVRGRGMRVSNSHFLPSQAASIIFLPPKCSVALTYVKKPQSCRKSWTVLKPSFSSLRMIEAFARSCFEGY